MSGPAGDPKDGKATGLKFRHDFRRTAVRNLERAGVSRSVAMRTGFVGMKTQSIYSRYAIKSKQDLKRRRREAGQGLHHDGRHTPLSGDSAQGRWR